MHTIYKRFRFSWVRLSKSTTETRYFSLNCVISNDLFLGADAISPSVVSSLAMTRLFCEIPFSVCFVCVGARFVLHNKNVLRTFWTRSVSVALFSTGRYSHLGFGILLFTSWVSDSMQVHMSVHTAQCHWTKIRTEQQDKNKRKKNFFDASTCLQLLVFSPSYFVFSTSVRSI